MQLLADLVFGKSWIAGLALAAGLVAAWQVDRHHVAERERENAASKINERVQELAAKARWAADAVPADRADPERLRLRSRYCRDC